MSKEGQASELRVRLEASKDRPAPPQLLWRPKQTTEKSVPLTEDHGLQKAAVPRSSCPSPSPPTLLGLAPQPI